MKLIFESLNDNRVKAEVCTETAILNCVSDIKKIIKESTDGSDNETKKGIGTKTLDMLKLGYKKVVDFIMKILSTLNEFRKKAWNNIKAATSKARSKKSSNSTTDVDKQENGKLLLGHKTYEIYDCLKSNNISGFITKITDDGIISDVTDVSERNKKVDEFFFNYMFGAKNASNYTDLPKIEVDIDTIDKALNSLEKQASTLVMIIKNKEKALSNPKFKDEEYKDYISEGLIAANRAAMNIGNMISHLLSVLKK